MNYLDLGDVRAVAAAVLRGEMEVRDWGLLESALARPRSTVFGEDAYPAVWEKAGALLLSLVDNRAFVDGNKRIGFSCAVLFLSRTASGFATRRTTRTTSSSRSRSGAWLTYPMLRTSFGDGRQQSSVGLSSDRAELGGERRAAVVSVALRLSLPQ